MMEPSAILLASVPRDTGFQMVSGILESSESLSPTQPPRPMKATDDTGLLSTCILEDGSDPDGGWVIEVKEGPKASKSHHLIC